MRENHPYCPFARYADDAVVHCSSQMQAQWKLVAIGKRLEKCGLQLNLQKIGHCVLQGQTSPRRRTRASSLPFWGTPSDHEELKDRYGKLFDSFMPAVSLEATKKMLHTIKSWKLSRQTPASIGAVAMGSCY